MSIVFHFVFHGKLNKRQNTKTFTEEKERSNNNEKVENPISVVWHGKKRRRVSEKHMAYKYVVWQSYA